jgi:hypothetical protein
MEKQEAETKKKEIRRMEQGKKETKRRTPYGLSYASCNPQKLEQNQHDHKKIWKTLLWRH